MIPFFRTVVSYANQAREQSIRYISSLFKKKIDKNCHNYSITLYGDLKNGAIYKNVYACYFQGNKYYHQLF